VKAFQQRRRQPIASATALPIFDAQTDPLGNAVKGRGMANRAEYERMESIRNPFRMLGPLADPQWEGFKQTLAESGVDELVGGSSPSYLPNAFIGQPVQPPAPSTYGMTERDRAMSQLKSRKQGYQTHDEFMAPIDSIRRAARGRR